MSWIGISVANQLNTIINNLSSDSLSCLEHMNQDDIKDTHSSYAKKIDSLFIIILTPIAKKRVYSLVMLVQDIFRVSQDPAFPNSVNRDQLIGLISNALVRERNRKSQKKIGESHHDVAFNTKPKVILRILKKNCSLH